MTSDEDVRSRPPEGEDDVEALLGPRIRSLRLARGWSQGQLAVRLAGWGWPMHQTTVAKLETGGRPVRINEAAALAAIFEVPLSELLSTEEVVLAEPYSAAIRQVRELEAELAMAVREAEMLEASSATARSRVRSLQHDLARAREGMAQLERSRADGEADRGEHR